MKKIVCIIICMLLFVTASAVTAKMNVSDSTETTYAISSPSGTTSRAGNILLQFDVQTNTTYQGNLGVDWDGQYFWSTGCAAGGVAPYFIIKWDNRGHKLAEYSQPSQPSSSWGFRDMAFDGTYLYSGSENGFWKIDPATGATTLMFSSMSPMTIIRALTWVPSEGMFYTGSFALGWFKFTADGTTITSIPNPGLTAVYGMAYDSINDTIWVFDQTGTPQTTFYEYNYHTQALTGKTWVVPLLTGETAQIAGGCCYATDLIAGKAVLGGLVQGTPLDRIFVMELGDAVTNQPPNTPGAPTGPTTGAPGVSYSFSATTTDPELDNISFMFDWGDGNMSAWLGPYPNGGTATASYAWAAVGTYDVKVKAKDDHGAESDWSAAHTITITTAAPHIEIDAITGGLFKVHTAIKNTGTVAATNVSWSIKLSGLVFIGKETPGNIASIAPSGSEPISSKFILGFGKTVITVTADTATKTQNATVLLFYIKIT
jgi:hypothetical protein